MLMADNKEKESVYLLHSRSDKTTNSCGINIWWAKDCNKQWIIVFQLNLTQDKNTFLIALAFMLAPSLLNPAWLNTCTYVPWRRLIFSSHSEQAGKKGGKNRQGEKEGGDR